MLTDELAETYEAEWWNDTRNVSALAQWLLETRGCSAYEMYVVFEQPAKADDLWTEFTAWVALQ